MLCVPSGPSEQPPVDLLSSFSIDPCAADILKLKCSEAFARILLLLQQQQQIKKKKMTTMMKKKTSATNKKEFKQQKEEEEGEEEKAENTNSEEDKEEEKEAIERCCFKNFKTEGRYLHCMFYNLAVLFTRCVKDNVSPLPFSVSAAAAAAKVGSHLDQEACLRKLLESAADTSCSSSSSSSKPIPNTFLTNNFEEGDELVGSVLERACLEVYVNAGREIKISEVYVQQAVKEVVVKLIKSCIRIRNLRFRLFRKGDKKEEEKEEEEEEEAIKKDQEIFFTAAAAAAAAKTRNSNQRFKQKMKQKQRQKQLDIFTVKICLLNIALEQATDRVENNQDYISDCCDSHLRLTKKKLKIEDLL